MPYTFSIFWVSVGTLTFEVVLTRIFALTYWHHFASLLISLALLGFGTAGSLLPSFLPRLSRRPAEALAGSAWAAAAAMPLCYLGALAVGLEPLALAWSWTAWRDLALVCLLLLSPFLLAAGHIGLVLAWTDAPAKAYAANLAGSAAGCLLAAGALAHMTPNQAVYLAVLSTLAGGAAPAMKCPRRFLSAWVLASAGLGVFLAWHPLPLEFAAFKDRSAALAARDSRLETRTVGLQGVVEVIGGASFHYAPGLSLSCRATLPPQRGLFVDGDLAGPITQLTGRGGIPAFVDCLLARVPYEVIRPERVLILNPGGGLNVLAALQGGSPRVTVLEEDSNIAALMTGAWSAFSGGLYRRPEIEVVCDDPLAVLSRDPTTYDLIVVGHGGRWESGSASGLGVTRLFTVDGVRRMLQRLTPTGMLALAGPLMNPPRPSIKALATAAEAGARLGLDSERAVAVVRDWNTVLVMVKPQGFDPVDCDRLRTAAERRCFDLSVLPGLRPEEWNRFHVLPGEPLAEAGRLIVAGRAEAVYDDSAFNLRPASRDRPYFFNFFRGRTLWRILDPRGGTPLAATEWGLLFTWAGLAAVAALATAGIVLPLFSVGRPPAGMAFFGLIGLGYMLAEITLLAEIIYRLGHPALAVPLVVGVVLLASGLGSRLWGNRRPGRFAYVAATLLPLTLLGIRFLPGGTPAAGIMLIPAALVMGVPFAGGVTHLIGPNAEARAWAFGVNGFCGVAGAMAAGLICVQLGHSAGIMSAAVCYLAAGWSSRGGRHA